MYYVIQTFYSTIGFGVVAEGCCRNARGLVESEQVRGRCSELVRADKLTLIQSSRMIPLKAWLMKMQLPAIQGQSHRPRYLCSLLAAPRCQSLAKPTAPESSRLDNLPIARVGCMRVQVKQPG